MKKLIIAAVLAGVSLSASAAETINFGTEAGYVPFEFVDSNNKIQGFDIDLANAMCKQMQATCTFTNQSFDSLIPSLKFRRIDAVISGMDITAERQKQVSFTNAYYDNTATFFAQKGKFADLAALKGKRVGIQNGTTHQRFLQDKHPEITAVPYDSYQNAVLDLKNGRIDAVFGDTAVVHEFITKNPTLSTLGEPVTDKTYFGNGVGIAVRKNNTELLGKMNDALAKVRQDGTYKALYTKWFTQ
ncbi:arginine ABC transporter substrate-binding protein [Rouxiella badensis]|uniref:arginine ABC transporter substrate-binding protein n=1 Tax=Rouxiella badensis TaxID=1646377 RepID=UPI001D13CA5E|nr:arginine ABC transporter substrate-binding protein [Rouxiella badensis]MCC3717520.1 arginine ABC transporter substrate-binding protein [Rouxiella badensis]MCC3727536.1 arginine ABC transporter substrate-binding protein [Rouxiella badensis]MCC3740368.1 arginine ABC transporter substrate-binding protein [Rouxiella badensis]